MLLLRREGSFKYSLIGVNVGVLAGVRLFCRCHENDGRHSGSH